MLPVMRMLPHFPLHKQRFFESQEYIPGTFLFPGPALVPAPRARHRCLWGRCGFCLLGSQSLRGARRAQTAYSTEPWPASLFPEACGLAPWNLPARRERQSAEHNNAASETALSHPSSHLGGWIKWPIQRVPKLWQSVFFKVNLLWGPVKES